MESMGKQSLPILVKTKSGIVVLFRNERPALGGDPGQDGWRRIVPTLGRIGPKRSLIAPATSPDPDGCRNFWFASQGRVNEDGKV